MTGDDYAHNPLTLLHIAGRLRSLEISPLEIFRRAGVPPSALLSGNGWVPREICFVLGNQATSLSGEKFFGAHIGDRFRLSDLGTWGAAILGAKRLEQACTLACAGLELIHRGSDLRLVAKRRHAELRFSFRGKLGDSPEQHLLGTLAVLRKIALLAGEPEAVQVQFSIPIREAARSSRKRTAQRSHSTASTMRS